MKNEILMRKRKEKDEQKARIWRLLGSTAVLIMTVFCINVFAADGGDAISTAKNLLSKAATAGGGLWAVWGLVTLGMSIKDSNGPGIGNAIWQILGGAIIIAAGVAIGALDLTMATS